MRVYLAGPIAGLSYQEATGWRNRVANQLIEFGIESLSPLRYKSFLSNEKAIADHYDTHVLATTKAIYTRDRWDVARSDIIFVNFLGAEKVSIGTVMEIAWADMLNKPIIIAMEEGNVHQHAMVVESAGYIVPTIEEGIDAIIGLSNAHHYLRYAYTPFTEISPQEKP